ncbi:MAG: hypothetical protein ACFFCO_08805 [Promethearchaeota archaeon]
MPHCVDTKSKHGYVFKTLLLGGEDYATKLFCQQASVKTFAGEYKQSVGVGLGVHSCSVNDIRVRMQLWDIAVSDTRWAPIRTMFRGGHAAIYVANTEQLESLRVLRQDVLHYCGRIPEIFLFYGPTRQLMQLKRKMKKSDFLGLVTPSEALDELANMMFDRSPHGGGIPPYSFAALEIPSKKLEDARRAAVQVSHTRPALTVSPELIDAISESGFDVVGSSITLHAYQAVFQVNLLSGAVRFTPRICHECLKGARKWTNLCLVAAGPGWSNTSLNQRELEVLSKIHAIVNELLPAERECIVQKIVEETSQCHHFKEAPVTSPVSDPVDEVLDLLVESATATYAAH